MSTSTDAGKGSDVSQGSDVSTSEAAPSDAPVNVLYVIDAPADVVAHDTWNNFAKAFFATYCIECHSATVPDPTMYANQNFNIYADVKGLDSKIRCGVSPGDPSSGVGDFQSGCPTGGAFPPPGQFPIYDSTHSNPMPTNGERLRIVDWINAGAPEE